MIRMIETVIKRIRVFNVALVKHQAGHQITCDAGYLKLLLSELLYLLAVLNLVDEDFCWFEAGDIMLLDDDGGVTRNVTRNFFLPLFIDETSKAAHIDVVAAGHGVFYNGKKCFYGCGDIGFIDAGLVRNLINNVCFRHGAWVLLLGFRDGKINLCSQN